MCFICVAQKLLHLNGRSWDEKVSEDTKNEDYRVEIDVNVYGGLFCMCLWYFNLISSLVPWFTF
jgi:hypothetical protein